MTATNELVFLQSVDNTLFANERSVADLGEAAQFFAKSWDDLNGTALRPSTPRSRRASQGGATP